MTSILNHVELGLLADEARALITGAVIQKVSQRDRSSFHFQLRNRGRSLGFVISSAPSFPCFFIAGPKPDQRLDATSLCMQLRRLLLQSTLTNLCVEPGDRWLQLSFKHRQQEQSLLFKCFSHTPAFSVRDADDGDVFVFPPQSIVHRQNVQEVKQSLHCRSYTAAEGQEAPFSAYIEQFFQNQTWQRQQKKYRRDLTLQLKRQLKLQQTLIRDHAAARDHDLLRRQGDILNCHRGSESDGKTVIVVVDVFSEEGQSVTIPLRQELSLAANIADKYRQASRLKRKVEHVQRRLDEVERKYTQLSSLVLEARENIVDGFEERWSEALTGRVLEFITAQPEGQRQRKQQKTRQPFHTFLSDDVRILVAKSAKDGDKLIKLAKSNDHWFHIIDATGAHVIIPARQKAPIADHQKIDACLLAIHFSQRRGDRRAQVNTGKRDDLRKRKGQKAGMFSVLRSDARWVDNNLDQLHEILQKRLVFDDH